MLFLFTVTLDHYETSHYIYIFAHMKQHEIYSFGVCLQFYIKKIVLIINVQNNNNGKTLHKCIIYLGFIAAITKYY